MRNGLGAGPIPADLPYAAQINSACQAASYQNVHTFSPLVAYAIAVNETIQGQVNGSWNAATVVSGDGGHGLFQLTSSFPPDWNDPVANALFACEHFLMPAEAFWTTAPYSFSGYNLVRAIAASFNAGLGGALNGHAEGNIDKYTTDNYAARCWSRYLALEGGKSPFA